MSGVAVVTDTTQYLPQEVIDRHGLSLVSLYVNWNGRTDRESEMPGFGDFYGFLKSGGELPSTSQPSVGDFLAVYEPLIEAGKDIVSIHLSGGISGTVRSAEQARDALVERGVEPEKDPYAVALVLTSEPPAAGPELTARQIESLEEMEAAMAVQWEAFEASPEEIEEARGLLPGRFRQKLYLRHAVWLDGEIVSTGTAAPTEHGLLLYGGATKPSARGRGAYRALIRARWDDAVALGTPALITQGGSMSRPILERLGFERVGEVHMLLDKFDP
jgi:hypothetical protein